MLNFKESLKGAYAKAAAPVSAAVISGLCSFPVYAAEGDLVAFDPSQALLSGFTSTANSIMATITACLPVVMSIMSAYVCIRFGIKFFLRFVK